LRACAVVIGDGALPSPPLIVEQISHFDAESRSDFLQFAARMARQKPAAVAPSNAEAVAPIAVSWTSCRPTAPVAAHGLQKCEQIIHAELS
jgi:hypothetical protein